MAVFLQHQDSIKVMLTDIMMPVMGCLAMARALRLIKPDLTIMVTTGLDAVGEQDELKKLEINKVLLKPYAPATLLRAIGRALDRR